MIDEKALEKYYKGKLLCENHDRPLSFKILIKYFSIKPPE